MRSRRDQCSSADTVTQVTCPSYVTDNEADRGSTAKAKSCLDERSKPSCSLPIHWRRAFSSRCLACQMRLSASARQYCAGARDAGNLSRTTQDLGAAAAGLHAPGRRRREVAGLV